MKKSKTAVWAGLALRLAPVLQYLAKRALAGAVAEEAVLVLELDIVGIDHDRRQVGGAVGGQGRRCCHLLGHEEFS